MDGKKLAKNEIITLRIGADPAGLNRGLNRAQASVASFSSRARASMSALGKSIGDMNVASVFAPLLIGGGIGYTVKAVGDLSEKILYYGMAAKKSKADSKVFRESLHDMAIQTGVDANTILGGISKIGEITGDYDFSEKMGKNLADAANASGASVEDLAAVAASLRVTMGLTADETQKFFNSLIIQGDQGSFTLQKLAGEGKALLAAASTHGVNTPEKFARFGGYLQVMNAQIKSEAELTTSVSSLFSELSAKAKDLNKIGVHVFDKNNEFNDFDAIMRQLMQKTGGNIQKLQKFFGASSIKALQPLIAEYKNGFKTIETIAEGGLEGMTNTAVLDERAKQVSKDFNKSIEKMKASALKFADLNLAGPVETLSKALQTLSEHQSLVTAGFTAMSLAAAGIGLVKTVQFGMKGYETIKSLFPGKNDSKAQPSNVVPFNPNDVQKVFVTNMGQGGMGNPNYYMDDDDLPKSKPRVESNKEIANGTKEMGRFRRTASAARAGLNKFGGTAVGMGALTLATEWAVGKIYDFGDACVELYNTNKEMKAKRAEIQDQANKTIGNRYGFDAEFYARQIDDAFNAMQDELNSFFWVNEDKVAKYEKQMNDAREKMQAVIKKNGRIENVIDNKAYMEMLAPKIELPPQNQSFNINIIGGQKTVVEAPPGVKPPKVQTKNTPGF